MYPVTVSVLGICYDFMVGIKTLSKSFLILKISLTLVDFLKDVTKMEGLIKYEGLTKWSFVSLGKTLI